MQAESILKIRKFFERGQKRFHAKHPCWVCELVGSQHNIVPEYGIVYFQDRTKAFYQKGDILLVRSDILQKGKETRILRPTSKTKITEETASRIMENWNK